MVDGPLLPAIRGVNSDMFYNRGDPSAYDFTVTSFTTDGTWRDLDLSAIVPTGAKAVLLLVSVKDDIVNAAIGFRRNGNSNTIAASTILVQVANYINTQDIIVACDANRIIEYQASAVTFTNINVAVLGWWL